MKYYPQIDGLRAIAVMAVVLFHLGVPGFSGGFIGVDIFFVISGYLITSHLLQEAATRKISLVTFYERRARRILPVLIAIMAFSLVVTAFLYDANTFQAVGTSLAGCSAFISNMVFMRRKGYFDLASHEDPLLHTWSLSVEEQFYIFLPLCIILLYRFSKKPGIGIMAMAVLSFAANLFVTSRSQNAAFYLSPTRAWEFLAGSLLSADWLPKANNRQLRSIISVAGICCIAIAICLYNDQLVLICHFLDLF